MRISPLNLKILAYTLEVEGFDSRGVLQCGGFGSIRDIEEDGEWVPVELFDRMMAVAIETTGDTAFGLVAGKSLAMMKYSAITPLAIPTPCLRQLLADISRFAVLVVERSEIELVETRQSTRLVVTPVVQGGVSGHFRTEQIAASTMQMLRFAGAENADIHHIDIPYEPSAAHAQRYAATFGPHLRFGGKECSITFNADLLDRRMATHDPVAYVSALTRAESLLAAMKAGSDLAELVRQWQLSRFPDLPSVCETAVRLGMNERSFRRQLAVLGTSHADLVQECQRLVAERLLAEGRQPLKQIAESVGFASVHSFHRAFRRWSGMTPSEWRDVQGASLGKV
jgi:AraC-like DNA-binding protein